MVIEIVIYGVYFVVTFLIVANVLFVFIFKTINLLERLAFAFKIANKGHNNFNWQKETMYIENKANNTIIKEIRCFMAGIKNYSSDTHSRENEENIKSAMPSCFHVLDNILNKCYAQTKRIIERLTTKCEQNRIKG